MATVNSRGVKKISRPARNVNLVVCAMRKLGDENGSTVGNIVRYLSDCCEKPAPKRQVIAALKRGTEFGILDRRRGRYFLNKDEKRHGRLSRFEDGDSVTASTRGRNSRRVAGTRSGGTRSINAGGVADAAGTTSTELHERDVRTRKHTKPKRDRKSKDGARRKKNGKKLSGRKSMKRTRFARSFQKYDLNDVYKNSSYTSSTVPSIESLQRYQGED